MTNTATADDAAREALRQAIVDLIRCRPHDWPEILATQAGAACLLNVGSLNLLADAAVQIATMANQLSYETLDDDDTE